MTEIVTWSQIIDRKEWRERYRQKDSARERDRKIVREREREMALLSNVIRKKSPNVYKSCQK